jgi:hypothetical protein
MKKSYNLLLLSFLVLATPFLGYAQNVGVDVASPVQKLDVAGGLRIGTTVNGVAGSIRWNGTNFQVHNGTTWINFGGGEVNSVTAGNGLLGGGTGGALTLDVNVDGTTIQINADILRVPSGGISTTQILDGTILTGDISTGGVTSSNILDGTILATDIATGAVATAEILDATILPADVAAGAVNTVLSTNSSGVVGWNNPATLTTVLQDRDADTRINVDNGGSPDDDHIRMTTVNVERVTIDNTGEVGIGTNTPNRNLHVVDATGGKVLVSRGDASTNLGETLGEIMFDSEDDTDPSSVDASAVIRGIAAENHGNSNKGGDLAFLTKQIAGGGGAGVATEQMRILSTGNVGIGTTAPAQKLDVAGTAQFSGDVFIGVAAGTNNDLWLSDRLIDWDNAGYYVDPGSNSVMNEIEADLGTITDPSYTFLGNANTGMFSPGADQVAFTNGGTETVRILANGNVGIGLTNPTYKFHVNGKLKTTGINETSDERLKKSILPIEKPLQMIEDLRGVTYYWRRDEFPDQEFEADMQYGLIAQEVEKVLPELVATDSEGWKSIEYSHLVPILLEAIKEQQELIKNLKTQSSMNQQELESTKAQLTNQGVEFMNRLNSLQSRFELLITRGVEQANSRPAE